MPKLQIRLNLPLCCCKCNNFSSLVFVTGLLWLSCLSRNIHLDQKYSICRKTERSTDKMKIHWRQTGKENEVKTPFIQLLVSSFLRLLVDGLAAAIHLSSPRHRGFRGRSKPDGLHTMGVLSAGTSLLRTLWATTGTRPRPKIQEVERNSSAACIHTSFVLHLCCICCPFVGGTRLEPGDILRLLRS